MLAANADLQFWARLAAFLHANFHQLAHAFLINRGKRIALENAPFDVSRQELADVIARKTVSRLRQVVSAEAEELSITGNLIGHHTGAWQLNHGANHVFNFCAFFFEYLISHLPDNRS